MYGEQGNKDTCSPCSLLFPVEGTPLNKTGERSQGVQKIEAPGNSKAPRKFSNTTVKRISVAHLPPPEAEPITYQAVDADLPSIFWFDDREWQEFLSLDTDTE